jgi:ribosomal protein S18 acetylase RimI-like enzyme
MKNFSINTVATKDADRAVGTIVLAFGADPAARWLYQDPHEYLTHFPQFVRAFSGPAFTHNSAFYVDGFLGAALWLPPGIHPDEKAIFALLETTARREDRAEVMSMFEQMDRSHPKDPHWYLPMIGVDPSQQHRGIGAALLDHTLRRCDGEGKLAYLESTSPTSVRLYERHGFAMVGKIQAGAAPPIFPMVREPRESRN